MSDLSYLVLESGQVFSGRRRAGEDCAGEVVFNTSHFGYEEMATDPSYYNQILVTTAPMQGNYGVDDEFWESSNIWINGFICLEVQESSRDRSWIERLDKNGIPLLTDLDTREIVLTLRDKGTAWGAVVRAKDEVSAKKKAMGLIEEQKLGSKDWVYKTTCKEPFGVEGFVEGGPSIAVLDFGSKKNIIRELQKRCGKIKVFPSRSSASEIRAWNPEGILLSNGPGDPEHVEMAVDTVKDLLGWRPIFGICMGHHVLCMALGGRTYKLKFGHRGGNHPVKDLILGKIYVTSQNHGYAVKQDSLPNGVEVTHTNLNDQTVSGIRWPEKNCFSVQFHPESHPGPHDAENLFDHFIKLTR